MNTEFSGTGMPSYTVLDCKLFFVPTLNGFAIVRTDRLTDKLATSALPIKSIFYNGRQNAFVPNDSISLTSDINIVTIEMNTPHFGDIKNLEIEYNYDDQVWQRINVETAQIFNLSDLRFGRHIIWQIRKRIGFGNSDFQYRSFIIIKEKAYHEKWWFFPVFAVAFIVVVLLFAQLYSLQDK